MEFIKWCKCTLSWQLLFCTLGSGHLLPGEGGREILVGGGGCNFFPAERGGVVIFFGTLGTILRRSFKNLLWGRTPRPNTLHYYLYHVILVSITTFQKVEDNGPNTYRPVGWGGGCNFLRVVKGGVVIFPKTRVQNSQPPLPVINDRSLWPLFEF